MQILIVLTLIAYAFHYSVVVNSFKSSGNEYDYQNNVFTVTEVPLAIDFVQNAINETNERAFVYNTEAFGPLSPGDPVIVIQVHDRVFYLKYLIASLADVKGISKALIIFSHDVFNEEMNIIVQKIKFCKVKSFC